MNKEYNKKLRENYDNSPKKCKTCQTDIIYKKRLNDFCSHTCAAKFNNKGVVRNPRKSSSCKNCGKEIWGGKVYFCSKECSHTFKYEEYINQWLNGEISGVISQESGEVVSNHIKKWMIKKYGEKCNICGWNKVNPYTGKIPIQFHHKDGDSKNNKPDNLEIICPSCHSLTKNFGSRGLGRTSRYKK